MAAIVADPPWQIIGPVHRLAHQTVLAAAAPIELIGNM
jgi:hypothetical protein